MQAAQIGAVGEHMAGEGVPEDVRRHLAGIDSGGGREIRQKAGELLAGQMSAPAPRREEPGRAFPVRAKPAMGGEVGGDGRARGLAQGDQALLAALAADDDEAVVALERRPGQTHQLGDSQTGRVEKLQKGHEAPAAVILAPRRRTEQALHFGLAQDLGQGRPRSRIVESGRRIGVTNFLGQQKTKELSQAGKPPRRRRRRTPRIGELAEVGAQGPGVGLGQVGTADGEEFGRVGQVPAIGIDRIDGGAALGHEHLEEGLDVAAVWRVTVQLRWARAASSARSRASASSPIRCSADTAMPSGSIPELSMSPLLRAS